MKHDDRQRQALKNLRTVRNAFAEFLLVPTLVIAGFLLFAAGTFVLDGSSAAWLTPIRTLLINYAFGDATVAGDMLETIAAGVITVTSITISLMLIALQQSASSLTHQVYDQFLRNWQNQAYFGFFVGLSLYALVTLASAGPLNPVIGASVALGLTLLALYLLLVLFYTTVHSMRPEIIIEAIHDHTLMARDTQLDLLRRTRRVPRFDAPVSVPVPAVAHGFITRIDIERIEAATNRASAEVEVVLRIAVGEYVVFGQILAEVRAEVREDALAVARVLERAIDREKSRDFARDPLDGVEELETIGWTSISTARSDPYAGVLTIYSLRDILARWAEAPEATANADAAPVVYVDNALPSLLAAFESLAVAATESMQHQSYAEVLRTFTLLFDKLRPDLQVRVEDLILRSLSGLGDHVLTAELEKVLTELIACLEHAGRANTAVAVVAARDRLSGTVGKLGSRSTRAH